MSCGIPKFVSCPHHTTPCISFFKIMCVLVKICSLVLLNDESLLARLIFNGLMHVVNIFLKAVHILFRLFKRSITQILNVKVYL